MKRKENKKDNKILKYIGIVVIGFVSVFLFISKAKFDLLGFIWLLVGLVLIVTDITVFSSSVLFPFGIGCIGAAISQMFHVTLLAQTFVFLGTSCVVWILIKFLVTEKRGKAANLNGENITGSYGIVTVEINPPVKGRVYLNGNTWSALSDTKIEKGKKVLVKALEGITVFVEEAQ